MRKLFFLILALFPALFCFQCALAEPEWSYEVRTDGVYITDYLGSDSVVTVPDTIGGKPVVSVSIKNNLLLSVLTLPDGPVALPEYAFNECTSLVRINGLENVTSLGSYAFFGTSLKELVFSDQLEYVDTYGLYSDAFSITIPNDITFDVYPVQGLRLEEIHVISGSEAATVCVVDNVLFSADKTELIYYPPSRNALVYEIPETTRTLAGESFKNIGYKLLEVYVPSSVESLGWYVFYNHQNAKPNVYVDRGSAAEAYFFSEKGESDYKYEINLMYTDDTQLEPVSRMIERIVNECTAGLTSDYDRALALHDWIIDNTSYDFTYTYTSALDVFRHGTSVCAGYQDAYSVLLTQAGIRNFHTGNFEHGFNAVLIDGSWCYVDCTWDDVNGSDIDKHRYFGFDNTMRYETYGAEFNMFSHDTPTQLQNVTCKNHYWYKTGYMDDACSEAARLIQAQLNAGQTAFSINPSFYDKYGLMLICALMNDREWTAQGRDVSLSCYSPESGIIKCYVVEENNESADFTVKYLADGIEIAAYAGSGEKAVVPETINGLPVVSIGVSAFAGNYTLREVVLPDSITEIKGNAFKNMPVLSRINIPASIEKIGGYAFQYCHSLKADLKMPAGLKEISACCFEYSAVRSVRIPSGADVWDTAFAYCPNLTSVVYYDSGREGETQIGSSVFSNSRNLTTMILPDDLVFLGNTPFFKTGITSLSLPAGLSYIGVSPLGGCPELTSVTIDPANPYFKMYGEYFCSKDGTTLHSAIANGTGRYVIPSHVTKLSKYAFAAMESMTSVIVPGSIRTIPEYCFAFCTGLTDVTIEEGVCEMQLYAIAEAPLKKLSLPASLTTLADHWLSAMGLMDDFHIPEGITRLPVTTCATKNLWIHEDVTFIDSANLFVYGTVHGVPGTYAEEYAAERNLPFQPMDTALCLICSETVSLVWPGGTMTLPAALKTIDSGAFAECAAQAVVIPEACVSIAADAFDECGALKCVILECDPEAAADLIAHRSDIHILTRP